ncbi:hypothetical protein [Maribacter sp. 2210JD10-5]|uniref:hypothetical protein n=1 Tax=Maribacter sp. 2210JD10-5 TaxID=3386272 RepID=UPI0039BC9403
MNQNLIDNLNKGLFLEISNQLLPWKTPFSELKKLGNPELIKHSEQRTDLIWKDENILNGLKVNLVVMKWAGIGGFKKKLTQAFSYISDKEFEETKTKLDSELGQKGKFKKINELEHKYYWNLKQCKIELSERERFGTYWTITVKKKNNILFWK